MSVMSGQLFVAVDRDSASEGRSMSVGRSVLACQVIRTDTCLVGTGQLYIAMAIVQFGGQRLWPWSVIVSCMR